MPGQDAPIVGRLAPSPTGGLHLGHARTFLLAWVQARAAGGRVVLRIEDIDASRVRPEALEGAIADLRWLGLDWDEGPDVGGPHAPYLQSQRMDRYEATLGRLRRDGWIYPCTCTRADIARAAAAPHAEDEGPAYPGTCSGRDAGALADLDRPYAWRFRVERAPVAWQDGVLGPVERDPARHGGDFVVARPGAGPSYQLAVVVDDAAMGVTNVLRGDDLVSSTPRQILIYRALGLEPPRFAHVPLAIEESGKRLAKRDRSLKLGTLREEGVDPGRLVGWLARACGWARGWTPSRPADWVGAFDLGKLPREPWVVDAVGLRRLRG